MAWGMRCQCSALISHGMVTCGHREKHAKASAKLGSLRKEEERWVGHLKGKAMCSLGGQKEKELIERGYRCQEWCQEEVLRGESCLLNIAQSSGSVRHQQAGGRDKAALLGNFRVYVRPISGEMLKES